MKSKIRVLAIAIGLFYAASGFSQTTPLAAKASAPTGASAAPSTKSSAAAAGKANASSGAKATTPTTAAAGGGSGKVWVNTPSKTYHCENTKYYGKTKTGEYMTEADAKAKGNHADHGKACSK